jgi:hypothetical protein
MTTFITLIYRYYCGVRLAEVRSTISWFENNS